MWKTVNELKADGWDFENECLSMLRSDKGTSIVRKNSREEFGVMLLGGKIKWNQPTCKVVKVLPTLDRARAYNAAIHR